MDKCNEKIEELATKLKIDVFEGKGPDFQENVPKTIHQESVK